MSDGDPSERVEISSAVKQDCVLTPLLFNLFFTQVLDFELGNPNTYRLDGSPFDLQRLTEKTDIGEADNRITVC